MVTGNSLPACYCFQSVQLVDPDRFPLKFPKNLFFMGIHYCFHGSEKWHKLSYPLVFTFEILTLFSIYINIVHSDKQYDFYALLDFNLTIIFGFVILALSELNDRLKKLEN